MTAHPIILRLRKGTPLLAALVAAVNQGIDAHLEAVTQSKFDVSGTTLEAHIDPADLPCLTRRLIEANTDESRKLVSILTQRSRVDLDAFTLHYIIAALWSSTDDNGDPLEDNHGVEDIAPEALASIIEDCRKFREQVGVPQYNDPRYSDEEKAGHDFWLTRNGHGAGFWDRSELTPDVGRQCTQAAESFGQSDLYVGDDGLIYVT